ncbi:MAG: GntR family transcriptional regulator [Chloroflexi bacterium]|nr:MAG: GntR family transcriptional regulator [Chloroflexota bacterium]
MNPFPIPKYFQLAERLRAKITSGEMNAGDQLPTEELLCRQHDVSRGTVRKAIELLQKEGFVYREQGRGTFVRITQPSTALLTLSNFDEEIHRQNRTPSTQLVLAECVHATPEIANRLQIPESTKVLHIARLRLANNQLVAYEERHLAHHLCPKLLDEDLENNSIHWLLVHKFQIPLVRLEHTVEIGRLSKAHAEVLQAEPNTDALFIDRLTFTEKDGTRFPAVWYHAIYREDRYGMEARIRPSL